MGPELAFTGSLTVADSPRNMCGLLKPWISLQGDMALSLSQLVLTVLQDFSSQRGGDTEGEGKRWQFYTTKLVVCFSLFFFFSPQS